MNFYLIDRLLTIITRAAIKRELYDEIARNLYYVFNYGLFFKFLNF